MDQISLNSSQKLILTTLINKHQSNGSPVSARVIANEIDRAPGTIRNQMRMLATTGLVESVAGPKGGYKPTEAALTLLDRQHVDGTETITLASDYERVSATVDDIDFTNVHHPELCRAQIHFQHSIQHLEEGDAILVGPTPHSGLVVGGEIVALDTLSNVAIVDTVQLEAPVQNESA
ncbi:Rrf2 family transcriptional regulator [Natronococcus occultus]|uniref:Putative transcriptional regulator, contains C-terminal CBS domains n=1 Tax=Natronococcus occultus SP4 TaxID=694430 RepID=L0K0R7_9EURY|nr:Rrf2 family transcriptional regulator [Natronococcus occultus]AGB38877.1 putative transcriptional regulator, contains C-terminal CBS domains [Natronococcus occultus SP4]